MNFISILYGLFLLSVLGIYWSLGTQKLRLWTLLIASLVFYASLSIQYLPLLLALTFINFRLGREIGKNTSPGQHNTNWKISNEEWQFAQVDWNRRRLKLLWLGVILNISVLLGFKYINSLLALTFNLPANSSDSSWKIIAPLGISFSHLNVLLI